MIMHFYVGYNGMVYQLHIKLLYDGESIVGITERA